MNFMIYIDKSSWLVTKNEFPECKKKKTIFHIGGAQISFLNGAPEISHNVYLNNFSWFSPMDLELIVQW